MPILTPPDVAVTVTLTGTLNDFILGLQAVFVHANAAEFAIINQKLDALKVQGVQEMAVLDDLQTQVTANTDAENSAVILLTHLHDLLIAAGNDPAKIKAITDQLGTSKDALAAAIVANTMAAPQRPTGGQAKN